MDKIRFQYYSNNARSPKPLGYVDIGTFLNSIRNPKEDIKKVLLQIQEASKKGDKKLKAELKTSLYSFTPCVHVKEKRSYSDIINFTGLTVLDFDKIDNASDFKQFLFKTYSSIIAAWLSPSGKGVKALVKIPKVNTIDEYKSYFYGLASEMEIYKGFDGTTQNAVLLLFIGWDKDILIRTNYTTWNIKGSKRNQFVESAPIDLSIKIDKGQTKWVVDWFRDKINSINTDGHPQLRDNSVTLGGYVGSGYLSYIDAINLVNNLIESNSYLQKGISGYQKTAKQAIEIGITKPLEFSKY